MSGEVIAALIGGGFTVVGTVAYWMFMVHAKLAVIARCMEHLAKTTDELWTHVTEMEIRVAKHTERIDRLEEDVRRDMNCGTDSE